MNNDKFSEVLRALVAAHEANPQFPVGKIMEMAASIATASLNQRASAVDDEQMAWGLRALVPDEEDGL